MPCCPRWNQRPSSLPGGSTCCSRSFKDRPTFFSLGKHVKTWSAGSQQMHTHFTWGEREKRAGCGGHHCSPGNDREHGPRNPSEGHTRGTDSFQGQEDMLKERDPGACLTGGGEEVERGGTGCVGKKSQMWLVPLCCLG